MTTRARGAHGLARSPCPIANALDVVGDKWTLLVVRDLLRGKRTYSELLASPERIPTNLLAERLERLERAGLMLQRGVSGTAGPLCLHADRQGEGVGERAEGLRRLGEASHPRHAHD